MSAAPVASKLPLKRIQGELANAQSEAMRKSGIYYWYDDSDMTTGKAMIIGPEGTPYAHCPLLFSVKLPADYPFNPPAVQFLTTDGSTRFHPNWYVQGKVCLSILGTWSGPSWSAVMNIGTVLSSIQSLLEANPIVNEPGYEKLALTAGSRAEGYAEMVRYRLMAHTLPLLVQVAQGTVPPLWEDFADVLAEIVPRLLEEAAKVTKAAAEKGGGAVTYGNLPYGGDGRTNWRALAATARGKLGAENWDRLGQTS